MKLGEFVDNYSVSGHYSQDRKLMSNNREGEIICYCALVDTADKLFDKPFACNWAVIFRGRRRKCLYAFINGNRVWKVKNA